MSADSVAGLQKILIVEDEALLRELYRMYLQGKGFTVEIAVDGEEALTVAQSFQPDLIFLDIMMPKRNGLDVLQILRTDATYGCQRCKIVLLTNLGDDTMADKVQDQIDGYAIKAEISLDDLVHIIQSFSEPVQA